MDVTVVVCIYNADMIKLKNTLYSISIQKEIEYEVIIADDGSMVDSSSVVEDMCQSYGIKKYLINRQAINVGTVRNLYDAMLKAKGKYIYVTSPGDMLYDEYTLKDFFEYANNNDCKCLFGNAVCYNRSGESIDLVRKKNYPEKVKLFEKNKNKNWSKLAVLQGHYVFGCTFFREKNSALKHISKIINTTKYVEDTTSLISYILAGEHVVHYDRKITWYEYGDGISTNENKKWIDIINSEIEKTKCELYEEYSGDKYVKYVLGNMNIKNKMVRKWLSVLRYPQIGIMDVIIRLKKSRYTECSHEDLEAIRLLYDNNI